jgi:hypothetical protein
MRKLFLVLFVFLISGFIAGDTAFGCSCGRIDAPQEFENHDFVFVGKVTETGGFVRNNVTFSVEKAWKPLDDDEVFAYVTGCDGIDFKAGETYLVYAYKEESFFGTNVYTSSCSRTALLTKATEDLKFLESRTPVPVSKTAMSGNMKIGLTTAIFLVLFLGIGFVLKKILKH